MHLCQMRIYLPHANMQVHFRKVRGGWGREMISQVEISAVTGSLGVRSHTHTKKERNHKTPKVFLLCIIYRREVR